MIALVAPESKTICDTDGGDDDDGDGGGGENVQARLLIHLISQLSYWLESID